MKEELLDFIANDKMQTVFAAIKEKGVHIATEERKYKKYKTFWKKIEDEKRTVTSEEFKKWDSENEKNIRYIIHLVNLLF